MGDFDMSTSTVSENLVNHGGFQHVNLNCIRKSCKSWGISTCQLPTSTGEFGVGSQVLQQLADWISGSSIPGQCGTTIEAGEG